jgi:Zn-dependent protease
MQSLSACIPAEQLPTAFTQEEPMNDELQLYRQIFGTSGEAWLGVTLLAGLLVVLIFRPERVQRWGLFRTACWLLALSVLIPPVLHFLAALPGNTVSRSWQSGLLIFSCIYLVGPILKGLSILFGLLSLIPATPGAPLGPARHPLE